MLHPTPRQEQIFRLLAQGYSQKEVARLLGISASTCYNHTNTLRRKTELSTLQIALKLRTDDGSDSNR